MIRWPLRLVMWSMAFALFAHPAMADSTPSPPGAPLMGGASTPGKKGHR